MTNTRFGVSGGGILLGRQEVELPIEYMQMLAALAETSGVIDLGLHCSRCRQDVTGRNGHGDRRWVMECACRTFIGVNAVRQG